MFRSHLDPLLARAHGRWQQRRVASTPAAEIDRLFAAIQREFQELRDPPCANWFEASAVALLIGAEDCAVANVGVDRAWMLRDGRLERISEDCTLSSMRGATAGAHEPALPELLRDLPGSYFGRLSFDGVAARWPIRQVGLRENDVFLLASGFRNIGVNEAQLEAALKRVISAPEDGSARAARRQSDRIAERLAHDLAEVAARKEEVGRWNKARWYLHSRLALAVVRIFSRDGSPPPSCC